MYIYIYTPNSIFTYVCISTVYCTIGMFLDRYHRVQQYGQSKSWDLDISFLFQVPWWARGTWNEPSTSLLHNSRDTSSMMRRSCGRWFQGVTVMCLCQCSVSCMNYDNCVSTCFNMFQHGRSSWTFFWKPYMVISIEELEVSHPKVCHAVRRQAQGHS